MHIFDRVLNAERNVLHERIYPLTPVQSVLSFIFLFPLPILSSPFYPSCLFLVPYANFTPHNLRVMSFKDIVQNTLPFVSKKNTPVSYLPVEDKERDKSNDTSRRGSDEGESFIPKQMLAPPQRSWLTYWRMGLEVLLVLTSVITLFFTLIYDKPLKQRQVECGRLLGQWRM